MTHLQLSPSAAISVNPLQHFAPLYRRCTISKYGSTPFFRDSFSPAGNLPPFKKTPDRRRTKGGGKEAFFRPFCDGDTFLRIFQRDAGPTLRFSRDRFSAYVADPFVVLGYFSSGFKVTDLRKKRANERTVYWLYVGLGKFVTKIAEG